MNRCIAWSLLLPLLGCVTQGKYDNLKHRYDEARKDISDRRIEIGGLESSLAQEQTKGQALTTTVARTQQRIADVERTRAETATELARLQAEQVRLNVELARVIKDRSHLKQSTEELQRALMQLAARKAQADRRVAEFKTLLTSFQKLIDSGALRVTVADGRMVLMLPSDVLFDSGSARLSREGKQTITDVANVLRDMPERRFQIEGHTDDVPIHTAQFASNWELAAGRALGVIRAMLDAGVDGARVSGASYGEHHSVARNDSPQGRAENRRIEIVLVPDLSMLPGYEELEQIVERS